MTLLTERSRTGTRRRWISFAIVSVAVYLSLLDTFIVNLAFPAIERDFPGVGLANLSWIFTAYAIVFAALLVPAGRLSDALGTKRIFLIGLGLFVLASAICALAVSPEMLIAARVLQAAGAALFTPAALAAILPEFPPEKRSTVLGAWAAVGGVGAASGPLLGAVLVQSHWRLIFLVNIPVGLVSLALAARRLRESRDTAGGGRLPDLVGTVGMIIGVGALTLTINRVGESGLLSPTVMISTLLAVGLLVGVVIRSGRHPVPALALDLLRQRTVLLAVGSALLFAVGFAAGILAGTQFLSLHWRQSILLTGLEMSPGPIMAAAVAIPASRILAPRIGAHRLGALGGLLVAAGATWLALRVGADPQYFSQFLPAQILTGAGVGMAMPSFVSVALSATKPAQFSTAIAITSMFQQTGNAFGAAAFVSIVGTPAMAVAVSAFHRGWFFIAAIAVVAALVLLLAGARRRRS